MKKLKNINKILRKLKFPLLVFGGMGILWQIIFLQSTDSLPILFLVLFWLVLSLVYNLSERFSFSLAMIFLIITPFPLLAGKLFFAEKMAVWWFLFVIIGLLRWLITEFLDYLRKD